MAASGNVRYSQIRSGDRTGSGNRLVTAASGTLTQNVPLLYDASGNVVATATRSGNTTEFATITGTKTTGKQLEFDASGNIKASTSDIGSGSGGGGGAIVFLEEKTASSSAQLDFSASISATYDLYQFEFIDVKPATNNDNFYMRVSTNGGSSFLTTTIYQHTSFLWRAGAHGNGGATDAQLNLTFNGISTNASYPGVCGTLKFYNPLGTTYRKHLTGQFSFFGEVPAYLEGSVLMGTIETTSAVNAVRFYFSSGNIASGTIRCYGIDNA